MRLVAVDHAEDALGQASLVKQLGKTGGRRIPFGRLENEASCRGNRATETSTSAPWREIEGVMPPHLPGLAQR